MAYAMRFMAEVEKGDCMTVQHQLLSGYTHANVCYLGVYPLHLAIELGDHDMCVLLLYAGAKTDLKPNGKDKKTALEMATEYSKDKKHKFNKLGTELLTLMKGDKAKEKLQAAFDGVTERIETQRKKDIANMKLMCKIFVPLIVLAIAFLFRTQLEKLLMK